LAPEDEVVMNEIAVAGLVAHICNPSTYRLRQENLESYASLGFGHK
jgi:hypothetical protein